MANKFKFKLNFASPCNYIYTRAQGGEVGQATFTDEQLTRYAEYIQNVLDKQVEDRFAIVSIYGGNLADVLPRIKPFVNRIQKPDEARGVPGVSGVFIDVELSQFRSHLAAMTDLINNTGVGDLIMVTCSTNFVDMTTEDTYALRYALTQGFCKYVTVALTPANIHRVAEVFQQFLTWKTQYDNIHCELYIDESAPEVASSAFDEEFIRQALENIQDIIATDISGKLAIDFVYRPAPALRGVRTGDALMADVMCEMTDGGVVYPGYDVSLLTDRGRDELAVGNIEDDFADLDAGRKYLFDQLDESGNGLTGTCEDMTRAVPWNDPDHDYSMVPSAQLCKMHELLSEYLPYRLMQHNDDNFA